MLSSWFIATDVRQMLSFLIWTTQQSTMYGDVTLIAETHFSQF